MAAVLSVVVAGLALPVGPAAAPPGVRAGTSPELVASSAFTADLEADERILRPARDDRVEGFIDGLPRASPAPGTTDLFPSLADGDPLGPDGDASFIATAGGAATYRGALAAAPSGVVTDAWVAVRVRAVDGPIDLRVVVLEGQTAIAEGPVQRLDPTADGAWSDLVDRFPGLVVASARAMRVELQVQVPAGGPGRAQVTSLAARVRLQVSVRPAESGLAGGARMTAVAWGRAGSITVGSAAGGLARAVSVQRPFRAQNADLTQPDWMRIASVVAHPGRAGVLYAAAGRPAGRSALLRSTDDGRTWGVVSGQPSFSAAALPGQGGMALPIGTLLAMADDPDGRTTIWAATVGDGLMRSRDGGATWRSLGLSGQVLVGLAMHPDRPGEIVLASRGAGTWLVTDAWTDVPVFRVIPGGPEMPEEVAWVGDTLWVAGGSNGMFRGDGARLVAANAGLPMDGSSWSVVGGVTTARSTTVVAACGPCTARADGTTTGLLRSVEGARWESIADPSTVGRALVGSGEPWQLADILAGQSPGGAGFAARQLIVRAVRDRPAAPSPSVASPLSTPQGSGVAGRIAPSTSPSGAAPVRPLPLEILVAADGAIWRSGDGGASWAPLADGLGGRSIRTAAADPAVPDTVLASAPGIGSAVSVDRLRTLTFAPLGDGLASLRDPVTLDVAFEGSVGDPGRVLLAVGDPGREPAGEVVQAEALTADAWRSTGYAADVPHTRPVAVAAGRDVSGARILVAAAHPAGGIVRRIDDGRWTLTSAADAMRDPDSPPRADLAWVPDTTVVYLFDPGSGIHRSLDAGLTWAPVWAIRTERVGSGGLAVGADPSVLYASTNQGVVRLEGADQGSVEDGSVRVVQIGTFRKPGPIALDAHGRLWVASGVLAGSPARLSVTWDPGMPEPTFWELASERYANAMTEPVALAVLQDGSLVVADDLGGVMLLLPARQVIAPWLPSSIVLDPLDRTEGEPMALQLTDPTIIPPLVDPDVVVVSADGDDLAAGTAEAPVATLAGAQAILVARYGAAAERLDRDVVVQVRSGRYEGQRTRWTFTHPDHIVRIQGVPSATATTKPMFVGCVPGSCVTSRAWFELAAAPGAPTNLQLVNLQASLYHRGVILAGGDPMTGWNGRNVLHRLDLVNIGTRFRDDITPEVWSAGVFLLQASRDTLIAGNRVWHSANRMRHANGWFHTVYASHGSTGLVVRGNLVVDTSGDFHVRDGSDGGEFRSNVLVASFLGAIVTEWSAAGETEVCDTRVVGNLVLGDWDGGATMVPWRRTTPSPDGRCAKAGLPDVTAADNVVLWSGLARR